MKTLVKYWFNISLDVFTWKRIVSSLTTASLPFGSEACVFVWLHTARHQRHKTFYSANNYNLINCNGFYIDCQIHFGFGVWQASKQVSITMWKCFIVHADGTTMLSILWTPFTQGDTNENRTQYSCIIKAGWSLSNAASFHWQQFAEDVLWCIIKFYHITYYSMCLCLQDGQWHNQWCILTGFCWVCVCVSWCCEAFACKWQHNHSFSEYHSIFFSLAHTPLSSFRSDLHRFLHL